jgi:hypothetical protein
MATRNGNLRQKESALRAFNICILTSSYQRRDKRIAVSFCSNSNSLVLVHCTMIISALRTLAPMLRQNKGTFILLSRHPLHAREAYLRSWRWRTLYMAIAYEEVVGGAFSPHMPTPTQPAEWKIKQQAKQHHYLRTVRAHAQTALMQGIIVRRK